MKSKNDFESDNELFQSNLETLVKAGWIEKSVLFASAIDKRGRVAVKFTKLGAKKLTRLKHFDDVPGSDDSERQQIYMLLNYWKSISPPPAEFGD